MIRTLTRLAVAVVVFPIIGLIVLILWPWNRPGSDAVAGSSYKTAVTTAAISSVMVPEPKSQIEPEEDTEYTKVEVRGTLLGQAKEYLIKSQDRNWKLELGKDKVVLFLVQNLIGQQVTISGILHVDGKLDTIRVLRVEPVTVPPMGKD